MIGLSGGGVKSTGLREGLYHFVDTDIAVGDSWQVVAILPEPELVFTERSLGEDNCFPFILGSPNPLPGNSESLRELDKRC